MDRCDIVITAYRLNAKQPAAKALSGILGLSTTEAAALAKRFPCVVRAGEPFEEAERICLALNEAGAMAELRESEALHVPAKAPAAAVTAPKAASASTATAPKAAAARPAAPLAQAASEPQSSYVIGDLAIAKEVPRVSATPRVSEPQPAAPTPKPEVKPITPPTNAENAVSGNVQMLDDGFGGDAEHGPTLELDLDGKHREKGKVAAAPDAGAGPGAFDDEEQDAAALELDYGNPNRGGKVEVKKAVDPAAKAAANTAAKPPAKPAAPKDAPAPAAGAKYAIHGAKAEGPRRGKINVRDKSQDSRGILATIFLPIVLFYGAAPYLCVAGGLATVAGVALYVVYVPSSDDTNVMAQPPTPEEPFISALDQMKAEAAAEAAKKQAEKDKLAASPDAADAVKVLEWSVATKRRARMRGVHPLKVEWPAGTKAAATTECLLLDARYADKQGALESTGVLVQPSPTVVSQIEEQEKALKASKRYRDRTFVALCLANEPAASKP